MSSYSSGSIWSLLNNLPGGWQDDDPAVVDRESKNHEPHPRSTANEPPPKRRRTHYPPRQCRICLEFVQPTFDTDEGATTLLPGVIPRRGPRVTYSSPEGGRLIMPCKCKGSQKYVHEECLGLWRRADPLRRRNYWECPTCGWRYRLQRLTWGAWMSSGTAQVALTALIFGLAVFLLGFVADPIINLYLDPLGTLVSADGLAGRNFPAGDDDPTTWVEHLAKGLAGLGLLGFAKFLVTLSPWQMFHVRSSTGGLGRSGTTGRDRVSQLSWITLGIGIITFLWAIWKGVRAWSRHALESASERVMNMPGADEEDDEDD